MKRLVDRIGTFGGAALVFVAIAALLVYVFYLAGRVDDGESTQVDQSEQITELRTDVDLAKSAVEQNNTAARRLARQLERLGVEPVVEPQQLPGPEEIDDPDPDDPELQEGEIQERESDDPETQDPDPDDPEAQDPEADDPEPNDPEVDDPDSDDPDPDDPEIQDPEVDDPEPNDPQDPAQSITFNLPFGLFPFSVLVCTLDGDSDPQNPEYSCSVGP